MSAQDVKSRFYGCAVEEPSFLVYFLFPQDTWDTTQVLEEPDEGLLLVARLSLPLSLFMSSGHITAEIRVNGGKTALAGW